MTLKILPMKTGKIQDEASYLLAQSSRLQSQLVTHDAILDVTFRSQTAVVFSHKLYWKRLSGGTQGLVGTDPKLTALDGRSVHVAHQGNCERVQTLRAMESEAKARSLR